MLHNEAIAGNQTIIEILLEKGVDKSSKTNADKTAYDYAVSLNWKHLLPLLKH